MAHAEARSARFLIVLAVAFGLAACGSSGSSSGAASTHLEITATGRAPKTVTCPGSELCARLAKTPASDFAPVPGDVACTQIYGGPQKATVKGTLNGKPVDASFSRENGCQTARWDKLDWLIGTPAGA